MDLAAWVGLEGGGGGLELRVRFGSAQGDMRRVLGTRAENVDSGTKGTRGVREGKVAHAETRGS
jgi:hypothetical protein